ncbi:NDR1/HIN1-like protein 1 [Dioscorea cayenensis subsp. rotundata]|uniref:NDR1/HIN1-like protein 1 n=1 Tax=Dioscorea cayennensis subsp. rotundata TaxID=55577 RepID=A0AB40BFA7_DIOCR|nr:NDR1/HIN1-like protein 1 [Dioscorea cayenensis subsp. rotundata]
MGNDHNCQHSRNGFTSSMGRLLCCTILTILILCGIIALILYLVYRPSKPHFAISGVAVYQLTTTSTNSTTTITTTPAATNSIISNLQFTVLSHNPNHRSSILYDHLSSYVTYRNQAITQPVSLPMLFQEKQGEVALSPVMGSFTPVPVSGDVVTGLMSDEGYGVVGLRLVIIGKLRYKSGPFRSVWYGFFVRCDVLIGLRKGCSGQVPILGAPECDVDV